MTLGGFLHALHIPMRGMIMAAAGAFLLCSARLWIGGRGTALIIGVIAAFLKLFSIGGLVISPAVAIVAESLLAEAGFLLWGKRPWGAVVAGMGMVGYTVIHKFGSLLLIYRAEIKDIVEAVTGSAGIFRGVEAEFWWALLAAYLAGHLIVGGALGFAAFHTVNRAKRRMKG